jgi:hypothetical protein
MEKIHTYSLGLSALIMAATTVVHAVHGGTDINDLVMASDLPHDVRATTSVVWHMITFMLAGAALIAGILIWKPNRALMISLALFHAAFAGLFMVIGLTEFADLLTLPQWIAFALCFVLTAPALFKPKP